MKTRAGKQAKAEALAQRAAMVPPETTVQQLTPDPRNANKGTVRGHALLEESIARYGLGRGILVDKHGVVIGGNKTLDAAIAKGLLKTRIVKTRGDELVVTQREDLDLSDPTNPARQLAYADNRVGELSLEWNVEQLAADLQAGVDLASLFSDDDLAAWLKETTSKEVTFTARTDAAAPVHTCPACGHAWSDE